MDFLIITCLVSAILCLVFALTIFTLRRCARILQEKKWANPFAITFCVLAGMYALRFASLIAAQNNLPPEYLTRLTGTVMIVMALGSGVTNYLFLLSAFRLSEPALRVNWAIALRKILIDYGYLTLCILCVAGLIGLVSQVANLTGWRRAVVLLPDNAFSALTLLSMGFVLFGNIRFRRDELMARVALWSSVGYAALYVFYFVRDVSMGISSSFDLLTFTVALLLKVGLFFPALSLLLLVSAPLTGIERLLKSITRNDKEFLESEGIVKSICEELQLDQVDLYVRLPGVQENKLALFKYPRRRAADIEDPQVLNYEEGTDYDLVVTTGEPELVNRDDYSYTLLRRISEVMVPIFFHNSVIGCLKARNREERFTEVDLSNLKRIATMISPAVQTYREMFALNKLSHDLSALQIDVKEYAPNKDIEQMCERVQNVTASAAVGLFVDAGFVEYSGVYPHGESLAAAVDKLLPAESSEEPENEEGSCRWFVNELKMSPPAKLDEQTFGRFIFAVEDAQPTKHPPIGTSPLCRRALTDLVTDTLLDFMRGYLNQLTDQLGERLSGLRATSLDDWHAAVVQMARLAKLPWVVVSESEEGNEPIGDEAALQLINRIELPEYENDWHLKALDFFIYRPELHEAGVSCVIRKKLSQADHTIWFGVAQPAFGPELEFISPWTYFLDHFCNIVEASLLKLKDKRLQIATLKPTYDLVIYSHDLLSLSRSLSDLYSVLEKGVSNGGVVCSPRYLKLIEAYRNSSAHLDELLKISTAEVRRDERMGCPVGEVLNSVLEVVAGPLSIDNIKLNTRVIPPQNAHIMSTALDVPFYAAANAFTVLINNAREVLRYERNGGERTITVSIDGSGDGPLICEIVDSGPGVKAEIEPRILKEPCRSDKPHSVGLGLFFAAGLLKAFNGNITYEGRRVNGTGPAGATTVFRITFPRRKAEASSQS